MVRTPVVLRGGPAPEAHRQWRRAWLHLARRAPHRAVLVLAVLALAATACSQTSADGTASSTAPTAAPTTAPAVTVTTAGEDVDLVAQHVANIGESVARTAITVRTSEGTATWTADQLGIEIAHDATTAAVRAAVEADLGSDQVAASQIAAVAGQHVAFTVNRPHAAVLVTYDSRISNPPVPPEVILLDDKIAVTLGTAGQAVDVDMVLDEAVERISSALAYEPMGAPSGSLGLEAITIDAELNDVEPLLPSENLQAEVDAANRRYGKPPAIRFLDEARRLTLAAVVRWLEVGQLVEGGPPHISVNRQAVLADLEEIFARSSDPIGPAGFTIDYSTNPRGRPVVVNVDGGRVCCATEAVDAVIDALAVDGPSEVTIGSRPAIERAEEQRLTELGIVERVATFTTPHLHQPYPSRVTNIQRMADFVRGTVVEPGESFSLNGHVGPRTVDKGFVAGGAIARGELIEAIGGGVSQFATTIFNAAFFAGLDINSYQMHSLYFSRYPFGREATVSYPAPDFEFTNNTDYGVLLWTRYTNTSISVDIYSTKNVWVTPEPASFVWSTSNCADGPLSPRCMTALATSQRAWEDELCWKVRTTRERRFANGSTDTDLFTGVYRPASAYGCDGAPIDPDVRICPDPDAEPEDAEPDDTGDETTTGDETEDSVGQDTVGDDVVENTDTTEPADEIVDEEPEEEEPCLPLLPNPHRDEVDDGTGDTATGDGTDETATGDDASTDGETTATSSTSSADSADT